jgi:hypothetical protein
MLRIALRKHEGRAEGIGLVWFYANGHRDDSEHTLTKAYQVRCDERGPDSPPVFRGRRLATR